MPWLYVPDCIDEDRRLLLLIKRLAMRKHKYTITNPFILLCRRRYSRSSSTTEQRDQEMTQSWQMTQCQEWSHSCASKESTIRFPKISLTNKGNNEEKNTHRSAELPIPPPCLPCVPLVTIPACTIVPCPLGNNYAGVWIWVKI